MMVEIIEIFGCMFVLLFLAASMTRAGAQRR
jgi:hypothetical protein